MANTSKRGFASMEGEKQRTIASKGGKAAHAKGTAHEWSSDEARAAGRKGGESRGTRSRPATTNGNGYTQPYAENTLASSFLSNAGRSLRTSGIGPATPEHALAGQLETTGTIPYARTTANYQNEPQSI